jgi:hypothetical protein
MTYGVAVMYGAALLLGLIGTVLILRLSGRVTERQVYAFRMTGVMTISAAIVLAASATAMWRWSSQQ